MRFCGNCGTALSVAPPVQQMPQQPQMQGAPQGMYRQPQMQGAQQVSYQHGQMQGTPQGAHQQPQTQGAPSGAFGGRFTPAGNTSGGYGMNGSGSGSGAKKSCNGLIIGLVAGVATLVVVVAVLAVMLLRGSSQGTNVSNDGGSYGTRNANTGKTKPEQTDTSDSGQSATDGTGGNGKSLAADATSKDVATFLAGGEWSYQEKTPPGPPGPRFRFHEDGTVDYFAPSFEYGENEEQPVTCTGTFDIGYSDADADFPDMLTLSFEDIPDTVKPRYPEVAGAHPEAEGDYLFYLGCGSPESPDYLMIYPGGNDSNTFMNDAFFRIDFSEDGMQSVADPEHDYGFDAPWLYARTTDSKTETESETDLILGSYFYAFVWTTGMDSDGMLRVNLSHMEEEAVSQPFEGASKNNTYVTYSYEGAPQVHTYRMPYELLPENIGYGIHYSASIGAPMVILADENGVISMMDNTHLEYINHQIWMYPGIGAAGAAEEIYAPVIEEYRNAIWEYDNDKTYQYLSMGMVEVLNYYDKEEIQNGAGYMIEDLSGDGIPELLIGGTLETNIWPGSALQLFTVKDGELTEVFQSRSRSSYSWMGGNRFYYSGSSGASNVSFGTFRLSEDGTETKWDSFYFSAPAEDGEPIFYFNTTGEWDMASSERLDMDFEEVWYFTEVWSQELVQPPLKLFATW
ncbi:MAG: hypothetical protein IJQ12_04760 [Lachnospiraceae bacterium]|nr:hypothetical protein [Lachnospiraceae bacterium]